MTNDIKKYFTWVCTTAGEPSFKAVYSRFVKTKELDRVCYIEIEPNNVVRHKFVCSTLNNINTNDQEKIVKKFFTLFTGTILSFYFRSEWEKYCKNNKDTIGEGTIDQTKWMEQNFGFVCYPKFLLDTINEDNVIILAIRYPAPNESNTQTEIVSINICKCTFAQLIQYLLNDTISSPPELFSCIINKWGENGLMQIEFLNLKKQRDIETHYKKNNDNEYHPKIYYKYTSDEVLSKQFIRIIDEIYHIKIFHSYQDVIGESYEITDLDSTVGSDFISTNQLKNSNKNNAENITKVMCEKVMLSYLTHITSHHLKLKDYAQTPFYHFLNFFTNRNYLDDLKLARGEMIYAESFYNLYYKDIFKNKGKLEKTINVNSDTFRLNRDSYNILHEQVDSKWKFIPPLCTSLTLTMAVIALFDKNVQILTIVNQLFIFIQSKIINNDIFSINGFISALISCRLLLTFNSYYKVLVLFLFCVSIPTIGILILSYVAVFLSNMINKLSRYYRRRKVKKNINRVINNCSSVNKNDDYQPCKGTI